MSIRILIALDVADEQATDPNDLLASVRARLDDEAGYLEDGSPIVPEGLTVTLLAGDPGRSLDADELAGVYEVGIEGVDTTDPDSEPICGLCGMRRPQAGMTACSVCA